MDNKLLYSDGYGAGSYQAPEESALKWSSVPNSEDKRKPSWYIGLVLVLALISTGFYLLTHDITTTTIIMVCALLLSYYGIKKPRKINYSLNNEVLTINDRKYNLNSYKYFIVTHRSNSGTASLVPLKRFAAPININFSKDDSERIIQTLGASMPMEHKDNDLFDKLMRYIGF